MPELVARVMSTTVLCALLFGCAHGQDAPALVLEYEDFGPPVAASELLGMDWWQWQTHGDSTPRDYDIKVVVHRNLEEAELARRYPVDPATEQDHRYVSYDDAIAYLEATICEDVLPPVTDRLRATRANIIAQLADPATPRDLPVTCP